MLLRLTVRDLALVEGASLALGSGLCVLTGETGAGKSLLVAALAALRGGRASAELIRQGAETAVVEGTFEEATALRLRSRLEETGIAVAPGEELCVRRVVGHDGRSRAFINDQSVTLATLRELGAALIDLHGQHEHQVLLDESQHARLLDEAAGLEAQSSRVRSARSLLRSARDELAAIRAERQRIARDAEGLEQMAAEVESLDPQPDEIEKLRAEREILRHHDKIVEVLRTLGRVLAEEDGSALERVGIVEGMVRNLEGLDPSFIPVGEQLLEARELLEDVTRTADHRLDELDRDPGRLEAIEDRLAGLERLVRRHGSLEAAREAARAARADLARLEGRSEDEERHQVAAALEILETAASDLTAARARGAERLAHAVGKELEALGFPGGSFEVEFESHRGANAAHSSGDVGSLDSDALLEASDASLKAIGDEGAETVRFLLAPNPGEGRHPLGRTAAGGELARVMLALRTALRGRGGAEVLVFDEVDSGVGGVVLDAVADRLAGLARERQVLCVTHQARIAARAHVHLRVEKRTHEGRTATRILELDRPGRLAELERLLAGREPGPRSAALAEELLDRHMPLGNRVRPQALHASEGTGRQRPQGRRARAGSPGA